MRNVFYRALIVQWLFLPLAVLFSAVVARFYFEHGREAYDRREVHILAANHVSYIDAFIIQAAFPLFGRHSLLPYTCIISTRFMAFPVIGHFLKFIGGFPAHPLPGSGHGIDEAVKRAQAGFTMSIFPQGGIKPLGDMEAKWGIIKIAEQLPAARIVPIFINRRGWHYEVVVGRSFAPVGMTPQDIMEKIYALAPHAITAPPKHSLLR